MIEEMKSGLRTSGSKATEKFVSPLSIDYKTHPFVMRIHLRFMSKEEFIENHASGTLRKNKKNGFHYSKQYLHERVAADFGYGFESMHESHINWGQPMTEGDCAPITEAGWHIDIYAFKAFPGDEFEAKYLTVDDGDTRREGVGIIIRKTSAPYIPDGHVVFSIIAQVDKAKHTYYPAINPC